MPIATLQDASNGNSPVVTIYNSYDVSLSNFTINGGSFGVQCLQYSYCALYTNTIQQSGNDGVYFARSQGIVTSNNISNNASRGIAVVNGSTVITITNTVSGNGLHGIGVLSGGNLLGEDDTIKGNPVGILAQGGSVVRVAGLTISDNAGDGVRLESGSTALFGGNVVTGNGGNGVAIHDLSFASFNYDTISGNLTQPDVACYPQYSATRGVGTVGGTTNCVEPQDKE